MFDNIICTQVGTLTVARLDLDEYVDLEQRPCLMVIFNDGDSMFEAIRGDATTVRSNLTIY